MTRSPDAWNGPVVIAAVLLNPRTNIHDPGFWRVGLPAGLIDNYVVSPYLDNIVVKIWW